MIQKNYTKIFILTAVSIIIIMSGCEYKKPQEFYPRASDENPIITSVDPDSAVEGTIEITINGQNFSPDINQNFVYFKNIKAVIKSATANELVVERPLTLDSLRMIRVAVREAFAIEAYGPYYLENGYVTLGYLGIDPNKQTDIYLGEVQSMAVDVDENLYVEHDEMVYKVDPKGVMSQYSDLGFFSGEMRMGPDGYLYVQKRNNKNLYRIAPGGGEAELIFKIRKNVTTFDFADNGYLYSGGEKYGLNATTFDGTESKEVGAYSRAYDISSVRVFDGYVYVAADTIEEDLAPQNAHIWKHEILENGDLGERTLVFDFDEYDTKGVLKMEDFTFSEYGEMYIGIGLRDEKSEKPVVAPPILILYDNGMTEGYYPGTLTPPVKNLCWGERRYLYTNHSLTRNDDDSRFYRIVMGKRSAPYYGRQ